MISSMTQPTPLVLSRSEAVERHAKHYYTGRPCKSGHVALRYVSTGSCVECAKAATMSYNNKIRGKIRPVAYTTMATLHVHPDDHEAVYALADYLNQQRGLPPIQRPNVRPAAPPPDPRTQWERDYTMHRERFPHSVAVRLATGLNPETHSPGWAHPRWADDAVAIGVPAARAALLEELRAPSYGGGAMPDYLK